MKSENLIYKIVNRYIGVSGGYLGLPYDERFTYKSHAEFYPEYCDLQKDTSYAGTTRETFIKIFTEAIPKEQAKIIRGIIQKFPVGPEPKTRTEDLKKDLLNEAIKLETVEYIHQPSLEIQSGVVFEALEDAKSLIENRKALSAVDRVHTALHGYLRTVCKSSNINFTQKDDLVSLVKKLFSEHSRLKVKIKSQEIQNIARSLASISDSLNPIRNQGSLAHPNETLLDEPEATLVINSVRSLMIYIDSKIK